MREKSECVTIAASGFSFFVGVDLPLARHVAHMVTRDPLVVFADNLSSDDTMTLHLSKYSKIRQRALLYRFTIDWS